MIGRFRRYARENGTRAALTRGAAELRRQAFSEDRLTVILKDLASISEPRRHADIEVAPLEPSHLRGLSELNRRRGRQRVDRRFGDNLERGLGGFVGIRDGEVVGYYWWVDCADAAAHQDLEWLGSALQLQPGDAYGSDFYLQPDARGGGIANEFLYRVESSLAERGVDRIWGYVDAGNREARWLYSSRGYQPIMDLTVRRVLSRRRATAVREVESTAS